MPLKSKETFYTKVSAKACAKLSVRSHHAARLSRRHKLNPQPALHPVPLRTSDLGMAPAYSVFSTV